MGHRICPTPLLEVIYSPATRSIYIPLTLPPFLSFPKKKWKEVQQLLCNYCNGSKVMNQWEMAFRELRGDPNKLLFGEIYAKVCRNFARGKCLKNERYCGKTSLNEGEWNTGIWPKKNGITYRNAAHSWWTKLSRPFFFTLIGADVIGNSHFSREKLI